MGDRGNGASGDDVGDDARGRLREPLGANTEIGRKLKRYFDDVVSEGVPDRFAQLLSQLERSDSSASGSSQGKE